MLVTSYIQTEFDKELLKRDSNGCVECPSSAGSCPSCPSGQQCELSSQTCNSCQEYYCATIVSKKTTPIGGIVGGVIGGLAFIALIAGILYYVLIYKKRRIEYYDEKDDEEFWDDEDESALDLESPGMISSPHGSALNTSQNTTSNSNLSALSPSPGVNGTIAGGPSPRNGLTGVGAVGAGTIGAGAGAAAGATRTLAPRRPGGRTRRVSSYESFTRTTKSQQQRQKQLRMQRQQRQQRQLQILQQQQQFQPMQSFQQPGNPQFLEPSNRNSVATSFSNASNILPIAYIPGVTVVPNPSNTRLIFSSEIDLLYTDSISIVSIDPEIQQSTTTTAIRAQARLVDINVDRIEEEDSEFDTDSDVDSDIGRTSSPFV